MKIRNRDRKIDISNIIINKTDYGSEIIMIINNNVHKLFCNSVYIDIVLNKIEKYFGGKI